MANITITPTGAAFDPTDTVTSTRLNEARNPTAALDAGTIVNADVSATADILGSKLADATVTKAKIENISAPLKVLGRTTAGAGVAEEVTINDDDDLSTASAITLATDESIKAYVDTIFASSPFTESFESPEANIPGVASGLTYTHGLSSIPKIIQVFVKCKVADSGYSIGDEVLVGDYGDAGQTQNAWASSTEVGWGHTYSVAQIIIADKNVDAWSVISSPNWLIFIRAYA